VVAGSAGAQAVVPIMVSPATADPGGVVKVTNGPSSPCPPPSGTAHPSASVDLYAQGSATPVNRVPYQGAVTASGAWSVVVSLAPDLAPGAYQVQAGCYTDSGLNAGFGPAYTRGSLELRLQVPGSPTPSPVSGHPGDGVQVGSGNARCMPPASSPSPRVRVSLVDASNSTRAEAEGPIDTASGRWSVNLRVPDIVPQRAAITAVCLARVGAPAPYARYANTSFAVDASVLSGPGPTTSPTSPTGPPAGVTTTTVVAPPPTPPALPPTPVAEAKVAEPTYTG